MSPHWQTYVVVIGGIVLACCAAAAVSKWRCERARRARVRRAVHRPLPLVDGAADIRTFGDRLRDALFDVHCEDALRVVDEDAAERSYARHPAVKEAAIARVGDEAEAWLRGRAS